VSRHFLDGLEIGLNDSDCLVCSIARAMGESRRSQTAFTIHTFTLLLLRFAGIALYDNCWIIRVDSTGAFCIRRRSGTSPASDHSSPCLACGSRRSATGNADTASRLLGAIRRPFDMRRLVRSLPARAGTSASNVPSISVATKLRGGFRWHEHKDRRPFFHNVIGNRGLHQRRETNALAQPNEN